MADSTVKYVVVKGVKYLKAADVVSYLKECFATEETDVRNRLNTVLQELSK